MSTINVAVANALADYRTTLFDTAVLTDSAATVVASYAVSGASFSAAASGSAALASTLTGTALVDANFDAAMGALTLTGPGSVQEVLTAGGPGSGADVIVENDLTTSTGEVFSGKAVDITALTLSQPYTP